MPRSIDLAHYEKAVTDEEWPSISISSSNDDIEDTAPMLGKSRIKMRQWPSTKIIWIRSPWFYLVDLFMVALVMMLWSRQPISTHLQWQGDVTGYVPAFSQQVVVFRPYPEFVSNHSSLASLSETREQWMKLLPPGQGFIAVDDTATKQYDLPKPIEYKGTRSLGTSMMHGLHCLYEIMAEYDMLALGLKQPPLDVGHMDHCVDYVRQLLLCGGDMALSGQDIPNGSTNLYVPHVCKNFDQMYQWLYDHRDNDAWQFGKAEEHFLPP